MSVVLYVIVAIVTVIIFGSSRGGSESQDPLTVDDIRSIVNDVSPPSSESPNQQPQEQPQPQSEPRGSARVGDRVSTPLGNGIVTEIDEYGNFLVDTTGDGTVDVNSTKAEVLEPNADPGAGSPPSEPEVPLNPQPDPKLPGGQNRDRDISGNDEGPNTRKGEPSLPESRSDSDDDERNTPSRDSDISGNDEGPNTRKGEPSLPESRSHDRDDDDDDDDDDNNSYVPDPDPDPNPDPDLEPDPDPPDDNNSGFRPDDRANRISDDNPIGL